MPDSLSRDEQRLVHDYREIRAIGKFYGHFATMMVETLKEVLVELVERKRKDSLRIVR